MKKLVFLFAMVFAVSMVMGQNTKTLNQSGGTANSDYSEQVGDLNLIYIKQALDVSSPGTNTAGVDAMDHIYQNGTNNIARLDQSVLTANANNANLAKIMQIGNQNKLVGATAAGYLGGDNTFATQNATIYSNDLNVKQWGGNKNAIGLFQSAKFNNDFGGAAAAIEQKGYRNEFVVYQNTSAGSSRAHASSQQIGDDNLARVKQTAGGGHQNITLSQIGDDNKLVGADANGNILLGGVATQYTGSAWGGSANTLVVSQSGNGNEIGLYQEANLFKTTLNNYANITQTGGNSKVGAYQLSTGGDNTLFVSQLGGGDVETVVQTSVGPNTSTTFQ